MTKPIALSFSSAAARCLSAGLMVLLLGLGVNQDSQAWRGRPHHHGPSISIYAGPLYPPYPYYRRPNYYAPARERTVIINQAPNAQASSKRLFVYPSRGQSAEQQRQDEYECYRWAADETGFDPASGAGGTSTVTVRRPPDGLPDDPVTGTVGGAALGAAGGALAGDAATGAAVGAAVGLVAGLMGEANNRSYTTSVPRASAAGDDYRRAFSTCLSARGYKVG